MRACRVDLGNEELKVEVAADNGCCAVIRSTFFAACCHWSCVKSGRSHAECKLGR